MENNEKNVFEGYGVIQAMEDSGFYSGLSTEAWNIDVKSIYDYTAKLEDTVSKKLADLSKLETNLKIRDILFAIADQIIKNRVAVGEHRFNEIVKIDDLYTELLKSNFSIEPVITRK